MRLKHINETAWLADVALASRVLRVLVIMAAGIVAGVLLSWVLT